MEKNENQKLFKEVMGNYPTGVTIVTTSDEEGNPIGLTVNSFASVSLDPLLVLWSIDHRVSTLDVFKNINQFAIHVLASDQKDLCNLFASKGVDRFGNCIWEQSEHKLPIIADTFAVLHCKTFKQVEAGDHTILIGEVMKIEKNSQKQDPLLYHRRNLGPIPELFYN